MSTGATLDPDAGTLAGDCPSADAIARFVEGGLDAPQVERIERHLAACAACMLLVAEVGDALASQAPMSRGRVEPPLRLP